MSSLMENKHVRDYLTAWSAHIRGGGPITISLRQADMLDAAVAVLLDEEHRNQELRQELVERSASLTELRHELTHANRLLAGGAT